MGTERAGLPIIAFETLAAWERWLAAQPADAPGLWIKFAKAHTGIATVSKQEAIDGALCHGWIDGQLDKCDADHWLIRFTPRKSRSKWSEKNRKRAEELLVEGRIAAGGREEIERAQADGRWAAAYAPQSTAAVPDDLAAALAASPAASALFERLDATNRYAVLHRVHDTKRAETRAARIEKFVAMLARGETIYPLREKARKP